MKLSAVEQISSTLGGTLLAESPLWHRHAHSIQPLDLLLFVRKHRDVGRHYEARRCVDKLLTQTHKAIIAGERGLDAAPYLHYTDPDPKFTAGELCEWLSCTSLPRRRAILFGLEADIGTNGVLTLTSKEAAKMLPSLSPLARQIVAAQPRHIKLPYLFWEYLPNGAAAPLFGLDESALEVSQGLGWSILKQFYRNMLWIDEESEAKAFCLKWAENYREGGRI